MINSSLWLAVYCAGPLLFSELSLELGTWHWLGQKVMLMLELRGKRHMSRQDATNGIRRPRQVRGPKVRANVPPKGPCWRHRVCHLGAIVVAGGGKSALTANPIISRQ